MFVHISGFEIIWWTRSRPIRTTAEIQAHIKILPVKHPYLYQKLAQKATKLHLLGMSYTKIGKILGITHTTAAKAVRRLRHCEERTKWATKQSKT